MRAEFSSLINLAARRNTVERWMPGEEKRFLSSTFPSKITNYSEKDFDYRYNSFGFRCDPFNQESEHPILFLGCSHTEGKGLPAEHTWAYRLVERFREKTGLSIPYWNLGISGAGIDTMAEVLYWFSNNMSHKPKFIFALFPNPFRRLLSLENPIATNWIPSIDSERGVEFLIDESFAFLQMERSLMILDQARAIWNCRFIGATWSSDFLNLYERFPSIEMIQIPLAKYNVTFARDRFHWGPEYHSELAKHYWGRV